MISKELLSDIIDSLSTMYDYANDGTIPREDKDYSFYFEELDKADDLIKKLWKIYELKDYSYIESKKVEEILKGGDLSA